MLFTYFMVGVAFSIIELTLALNIPFLRRWMESSPVLEIIISLGLGCILAYFMSIPAGVTVAIGGVFATAITKAVYSMHLFEAFAHIKDAVLSIADSCAKMASELQQLIHFVWVVVTLPFRIAFAIARFLNSVVIWGKGVKSRFA